MSHTSLSPMLIALLCVISIFVTAKEKVYFMDFEHLNVTYWNTEYYGFMNCTARRHSRLDPIHYLDLHYDLLVSVGNNVQVDVYMYEFLSNEYRRSFVEMHYRLCDFMFRDATFGILIRDKLAKRFRICPFPKGMYHLENISISDLPLLRTFPFQKGRLYVNLSQLNTGERLVEAYIDHVIKTKWR